jgi:hypothetical protein
MCVPTQCGARSGGGGDSGGSLVGLFYRLGWSVATARSFQLASGYFLLRARARARGGF